MGCARQNKITAQYCLTSLLHRIRTKIQIILLPAVGVTPIFVHHFPCNANEKHDSSHCATHRNSKLYFFLFALYLSLTPVTITARVWFMTLAVLKFAAGL